MTPAPRQRDVSNETAVGATVVDMTTYESTYPVRFSVDYPDRTLNRVTTAFRIFAGIPIFVVLTAGIGRIWEWSQGSGKSSAAAREDCSSSPSPDDPVPAEVPALVGSTGTSSCSGSPTGSRPTSRSWTIATVHHGPPVRAPRLRPIPTPPAISTGGLPLVKVFAAIPPLHRVGVPQPRRLRHGDRRWFVILFTGRYPRGIFDFVQGVFRWNNRSSATPSPWSPTATRRSASPHDDDVATGLRQPPGS